MLMASLLAGAAASLPPLNLNVAAPRITAANKVKNTLSLLITRVVFFASAG
jgi:hypothetical protein